MSKYLYGVSVQGIQDFIFKTNKLKEIIGASEIVKKIDKIDLKDNYKLDNKPHIILQAAGNLRAIFENKKDLEKVVKNFPKDIMLQAYGITISQAVVEYTNYKESSKKLEKLLKEQRNKVSTPLDTHFSILKQNSKTAKPLINEDNDKATQQKVDKCPKDDENKELKDISNDKNKIAIIHIDGNGLGNKIKDMDENTLQSFSSKLQKANEDSFEIARKDIKLREVILGGDDLTVICNANDALTFTQTFIKEFEQKSGLYACAGITYCNEKYPFHYAIKLAEDLCSWAKKDSKTIDKDNPPSSVMFHNIQSSNVESFSKFIDDELTIGADKDKVRCDFGPYFIQVQKDKPTLENFLALKKDFEKENSPKGRLRDWLSTLSYNKTMAEQQLKRMNEVTKWSSDHIKLEWKDLIVNKDQVEKTPIYDVLQILSVEDVK